MAQIPRAEPGLKCPLWKKPMEQVCHTCPWWMHMRGHDDNKGGEIDQWGCAIAFLPPLLVTNAKMTRGAAAATEDLRNDLVAGVIEAVGHAAEHAGRLLEAQKS